MMKVSIGEDDYENGKKMRMEEMLLNESFSFHCEFLAALSFSMNGEGHLCHFTLNGCPSL
jgi:hypothetical protein